MVPIADLFEEEWLLWDEQLASQRFDETLSAR